MIAGRWTSVRVQTTARSEVIGALFANGAEAVQETDDAIVTHLRQPQRARLDAAIRRADSSAVIEFGATPDVDWSEAWRASIRAHRVGRLVVTPPWLASGSAPGERIVIVPGMAFGTGEHETTRGVLRLMQDVTLTGCTVADLGAGSAVLSIAATKLGAARVAAIELDDDAIGNAEENVAANGTAAAITVLAGDAGTLLPLLAPVDVVLANIVSSVLLELLPVISASLTPAGRVVLGGMLTEERDHMEREFADAGWVVERSLVDGSWWSATLARR